MLTFAEKLHVTSLQQNVTRNRFRQFLLGDISHLLSNATIPSSRGLQVFWITGRASLKQSIPTGLLECSQYGATLGGREQRLSYCASSFMLYPCSRPANVVPTCATVCAIGPGNGIARTGQRLPFVQRLQQRGLVHNSSAAQPSQQTRGVTMSSRETGDDVRTSNLTSRAQPRRTADASSTPSDACREDTTGDQMVAPFHTSARVKTGTTTDLPPRILAGDPVPKTGFFEPVRIASYVPRQEQLVEPAGGKKASRGRSLLIFLLCSCFPVVLLAALFASIVETRKAEQQVAQQAVESEEDYLRAAYDLVATTTLCYCLHTAGPDGATHNAVFVDPHLPEARLLRLPEAEVVPGLKGNSLTDLLLGEKSDFSLPFNFIHFALARSSPAAASVQDGKKISLFYVHPRNGSTLLVSGFAAIVLSKEQRRHYWRNRWEAALPGMNSEEYVLLKFVPDTLQLSFPPRLAPAEKYTWSSPVLRRLVTDTEISWVLTPTVEVKQRGTESHCTR